MKKQLILIGLVLALAGAALAQMSGLMMVRGKCTDVDGKPYTNGFVRIVNTDNGRKYEMKLNSKGEYMQAGVPLGKYDATLVVDGKDVFRLNGIQPDPTGETVIDFDMKKELANATATSGQPHPGNAQPANAQPAKGQPAPLSEAEKKENAKIENENMKIRDVNKLIQAADAAASQQPPNYDQAIASMTQATQAGPSFPLVWIKLGDYQTKAQKWDDAVPSLQKAIETTQAQPPEKVNKAQLAGLQNNLGSAYLHTHKMPEAAQQFEAAAQTNPAGAGMFYTNEAIALQNMGKMDESIAAADKAIAADPKAADAYYWKGIALMGKATTKGNKITAPDGTAEAFNKYLELQPTGKFSQASKDMLGTLGMSVETGYKQPKKPK
jgi:Tfp pilus assembly protein PilF